VVVPTDMRCGSVIRIHVWLGSREPQPRLWQSIDFLLPSKSLLRSKTCWLQSCLLGSGRVACLSCR